MNERDTGRYGMVNVHFTRPSRAQITHVRKEAAANEAVVRFMMTESRKVPELHVGG